MDPLTIAAIGGLATSAYSTYASSKASSAATSGQQAANAQNFAESQRNRDFQERMTRNKHQYEVKDLIAAGLNPILSATAGAAVPGGSSAKAENVNVHKPQHAIAKQQLIANLQSTAQDIKLKHQMAKTEQSKTNLNHSQAQLVLANASSARSQALQDKQTARFKTNKTGQWIQRVSRFADPLRGILGGQVSKQYKG